MCMLPRFTLCRLPPSFYSVPASRASHSHSLSSLLRTPSAWASNARTCESSGPTTTTHVTKKLPKVCLRLCLKTLTSRLVERISWLQSSPLRSVQWLELSLPLSYSSYYLGSYKMSFKRGRMPRDSRMPSGSQLYALWCEHPKNAKLSLLNDRPEKKRATSNPERCKYTLFVSAKLMTKYLDWRNKEVWDWLIFRGEVVFSAV